MPLAVKRSLVWRWLSPILSAAVLIAILFQLRHIDIAQLQAIIPRSPLFWIIFVVYYFSGVVCDYWIFRRLWGIPREGLIALTRKMVSNELVFGYIGEVYFYSWARRKVAMPTSPFGAVKDVAILSAVAGNVVTLAMIALAWPIVSKLSLPVGSRTIAASLGVMILISMVPLVFGKRVLSLPRRDLWFVAGIHVVRILVGILLASLCWSLALPLVEPAWWLILATVRMLISRLPLVPQKDIMFAGIATLLVGHDMEVAALMTFMAALMLMTHLLVGGLLAIGDFINLRLK